MQALQNLFISNKLFNAAVRDVSSGRQLGRMKHAASPRNLDSFRHHTAPGESLAELAQQLLDAIDGCIRSTEALALVGALCGIGRTLLRLLPSQGLIKARHDAYAR